MSDSLIQFPAMASGASFAGTCLMHTMMFTRMLPFGICQNRAQEKPRERAAKSNLLLSRPAPENERGVGAAKSKGIRKRVFDRCLASMIRYVIQIAFGIGILEVNRGRERLVAQCQNADSGFQATRAAQQMAGHGFRRADWDFLGAFTENALQRAGLDHVADGRGCAMSVHVADVVGSELRVFERRHHHAISAIAVLFRLG